MDSGRIFEQLKAILVDRLKFDPRRAAEVTPDTALPKGMEGSLGLDSLDFIELSVAIEERFGLVMDGDEDLVPHFRSFATLTQYITQRGEQA